MKETINSNYINEHRILLISRTIFLLHYTFVGIRNFKMCLSGALNQRLTYTSKKEKRL